VKIDCAETSSIALETSIKASFYNPTERLINEQARDNNKGAKDNKRRYNPRPTSVHNPHLYIEKVQEKGQKDNTLATRIFAVMVVARVKE
jgi:hypothetical protein